MRLHQKIAVAVAVVLIAVGVYVDAVLLPDAESKPGPTVDGVASERAAGKRVLERNFSQIEQAIPELDRSAEAFANRCDEGQQNYKVDEGYAYKCTYKITRFYGSDESIDTLEVSLDRSLRSNNWISSKSYSVFDKLYRKKNINIDIEYTESSGEKLDQSLQSIAGNLLELEEHTMQKFVDLNKISEEVLTSYRYALAFSMKVVYYLKK